MSYRYVIDAYAWIEYFRASKHGEAAKRYIEGGEAATPTIVVAEVSRKLLKEIEAGNETREGRMKRLEFIRATTQIVELNFEIAKEAGTTWESTKNALELLESLGVVVSKREGERKDY